MAPQSNDGVHGYRVLDREVYPSLDRIVRDCEAIHLEPRVMDLLVFFLEHPGDVLSREAIVDAVWCEQFVGEGVIRQSVAAIRRALGDDARKPSFVETIPKRGYRLISEVERFGPAGDSEDLVVIGPEFAVSLESPSQFQCSLRYGRRSIRLVDGENIIGRTPEAAVQIASDRVSREHARILIEGGRATLEDLGSKNGTILRGERIEEPTELADGDTIEIGRVVLIFRGLYTARTATDRGMHGDR